MRQQQAALAASPAVTTIVPVLERLESARSAARERLQQRRDATRGPTEWLRLEARFCDLGRRLASVEDDGQSLGQAVREVSWLLAEDLAAAYDRFLAQG
jgi:hypothetical protein